LRRRQRADTLRRGRPSALSVRANHDLTEWKLAFLPELIGSNPNIGLRDFHSWSHGSHIQVQRLSNVLYSGNLIRPADRLLHTLEQLLTSLNACRVDVGGSRFRRGSRLGDR